MSNHDHQQNNSSIEIEELQSRIDSLEKFASSNRERIKNSKALNALLVVLIPLFLLTGDIQFGEKWTGSVKSREIEADDIASLLAIGASAIGVISSEKLGEFFKK